MDKPNINAQMVYTTVAALLPTEGRDFTLDVKYTDGNKATLVISPISPIGRAWTPFLEQALAAPLGREGTTVTIGGAVAQEVMTIRSIREKAEAEAAASLSAKIEAAKAEQKRKSEEVMRLREEQEKKEGDNAAPSEQVRAASRDANNAAIEAFRLIRIQQKVSAVRQSIDDAALRSAKDDLKNGKNWAVNMDEPLVSLFDRQDVSNKMHDRERAIMDIAGRLVAADDIKNAAVGSVKQYIMPKEAADGTK